MRRSNLFVQALCAFMISFACMSLPATSPLGVAAAQAPTDISKAYFNSGWFEKNASGEWDEYNAQGKLRYTFRETRRDANSIELYLKEYGVTVEIQPRESLIYAEWPGMARHVMHKITNMEIIPPTAPAPEPEPEPQPQPQPQPEPQPEPQPMPMITPASIAAMSYDGGEFIKDGDGWMEVTAKGERYRFETLGYDANHVYLLDASRKAFVVLDMAAKKLRYSDGGELRHMYDVTELSMIAPVDPEPETPEPPVTEPFPEAPKLTVLERATCVATGGTVEAAGILGAERCTRRYSDGGKSCTDSSQCQGRCLADIDGANQETAKGVCEKDDNPFGCYAVVRNGETGPALCVD